MLDSFEIVTSSGIVLWSRSYAPVGAHIINSLIKDVFVEEKLHLSEADAGSQKYKKDKYTLKWRKAKDFGLIFVVCCSLSSCKSGCRLTLFPSAGSLPVPPSPELDRRVS
jgi:hypothetical protein